MENKAVLVEMFGEEIGSKLFGAAVKLSIRMNVELDDFVQDLAISAMHVEKEYGFVHIQTAVNHAKNAVYTTYRYGVNQYYSEQGVSEDFIESHDEDADGNAYLDLITFDQNSIVRDDLSEQFAESLESLDDKTRKVLAMLPDYKGIEIAEALGRSSAWVSGRKKQLQEVFGWAIA